MGQCHWDALSSIIDHWGDYGGVLQRWAGRGHWHDMDMLLVGANCVTADEERTQMAIWSISASPLIMGNDLRNVSAASKQILLNKDAIAVSQDPLGKMGIRHKSFSSASPTQVWYRELSHGDIAVALYNKASGSNPPIPGPPCSAWNKTDGGYLEACGGGSGNVGSFSGLSLEQAQDACCKDTKCAGFDFRSSDGSGFYKGNQNCGLVKSTEYVGYTKPSQMPQEGGKADIKLNFAMIGLSGKVHVYDIWAQKDMGTFEDSFTARDVPKHGTAFLRLSSSSTSVIV